MKLLYIWIDKYKSLNDVEINFTNEHKFSYDKESSIITYERNESVLNNFYCDKTSADRLIDIHAIVGDNGVGKSSILEGVINLAINMNDSSTSGIVAFMNNDGMILVFNKYFLKSCNKNIFIKYDKKYESKFKLNSDSYRKVYSVSYIIEEVGNQYNLEYDKQKYIKDFSIYLNDYRCIYYSNIFDKNIIGYVNGDFKDISTNGLFRNGNDIKEKYKYEYINEFFYDEILRQINFVYEYNNQSKKKFIPFKLPDRITLELRNIENEIRAILKKFEPKEQYLLNLLLKLNSEMNNFENLTDTEYLKKSFIIQVTIKFILECFRRECMKDIQGPIEAAFIRLVFNFDSKETQDEINLKDMCKRLLYKDSYDRVVNEVDSLFEVALNKYGIKNNECKIRNKDEYMYINYFYEFYQILKDLFKTKCDLGIGVLFLLVNDKNTTIKEVFNKYKKTVGEFGYINFSWELSSGEYNLLSQLARFYSTVEYEKIKNEQINDIIILIDEGDNTFHPRWQQNYINDLVSFIKDLYKGVNLQFIFTTHSPITLSDIINENITYLRKDSKTGKVIVSDNKKNTFGANIYDLYNDAFFLNDSNYGIIGKYAQKRIEETEIMLSNLCEKLKDIDKELEKKKYINDKNRSSIFYEKIDRDTIIKQLDECKAVIDVIGEKVIAYSLKQKYDYIINIISKYELKDNRKLSSNSKVNNMIENYSNLSEEEKKSFLKYLISDN